jgi:two-component system response regulator GlrR
LQVTLPPLRDRLEDIPLLVDHFVSLFNEREARDFIGFSPAALRVLQDHQWPGNVRELESVVYRSLVMAGAARLLDAEDLQLGLSTRPQRVDFGRPFSDLKADAVERFERKYLEELLRHTGGNLSKAARVARHERKSLWRLLRKYDIDAAAYRAARES